MESSSLDHRITEAELSLAELEITEERLLEYSFVLASDDFGGRFPGTEDETKTLQYLERQARAAGCSPGNRASNSFEQSVPLVKVTPVDLSPISINGGEFEFSIKSECMIWSSMIEEEVNIQDSDIIFLGYGISAPHQQWDDFADLDLVGKTIVVLVNDPGFASNDENLFNGRAMTYFGRWTYKVRPQEFETQPNLFEAKQTFPISSPYSTLIFANRSHFHIPLNFS